MLSRSLVILVLAGLLAACGGSASDDPTATVPANTEPVATQAEPAEPDNTGAVIEVPFVSYRTAPYGGTVVEGIVANTGDVTAVDLDLAVAIYDPHDALSDSSGTAYIPRLLHAGQSTPFLSVFPDVDPGNIGEVRANVSATAYDPERLMADYYSVDFDTASVQAVGEKVTGEIQNNTDRALRIDRVLVAGYDAGGTLLGVVQVNSDQRILAPGAATTFSTETRLLGDTEPATLEALAYGRES